VELPAPSLDRVLEDVRERLYARVIVTEGGPRLVRAALEQDLVTDVSLTIAPMRVGSGPLLFATELPHSELLPADVVDGYTFAHWDLTGAASRRGASDLPT
jgi:riboflavin biosynthesis pyrimidine reductase